MSPDFIKLESKKAKLITNKLTNLNPCPNTNQQSLKLSKEFYEQGVNALDILSFFKTLPESEKCIFTIEKMIAAIKSEKLLMFSIISEFLRSREV